MDNRQQALAYLVKEGPETVDAYERTYQAMLKRQKDDKFKLLMENFHQAIDQAQRFRDLNRMLREHLEAESSLNLELQFTIQTQKRKLEQLEIENNELLAQLQKQIY